MKKILLTLAALALSAAAFAQDREIDLEELGELNKIEIASGGKVETDLNLAFPMYFGASTLVGTNYKGAWAAFSNSHFLDMRTPKNFVYGLQLADLRIRYNALDVSLGLRWTFMDFTFADSSITLRVPRVVPDYADDYATFYRPIPIATETSTYDGRKSKIHASYFGIPLRLGLKFGKAMVYAGGSVEMLTGGYTKYKRPKYRSRCKEVFNPFRATVEGGFNYGGLGVFVMYGLTPLFQESLSDARTLTFGVTLGM